MEKRHPRRGIMITSDKILFFDMDGTLVDTNLANFSAYKKAINYVIKDNKLVYNHPVRFNRSILRTTFPNLTEKEIEKIIQLKESFYNEFLSVNYTFYNEYSNDPGDKLFPASCYPPLSSGR
jgi:FMN phosphatase YigB (HAD superfamily)